MLTTMWSIALHSQLGQQWPTVEVHRPALLVLGVSLLVVAAVGATWALVGQRRN